MPLLSNKLYILNKIRKKDEEVKYLIPLTNEICEDEAEKSRKEFLYENKIWICRISGQINLTYREAMKSEQSVTKMLKNSYKKCYEKATLQFVHHSRDSLETLIHKAWTFIHQEYCLNEPVVIKVANPDEIQVEAIIVKVDRSEYPDDKREVSPNEKDKKKVIPEKKKYHYVVKIPNMDKLVNNIPTESIERALRPPSKDLIRLFIRAHAVRHSGKQLNPWIVDEDLVKKHKLPNLEPEFVLDKAEMRSISVAAELQMYKKLTSVSNDNDIGVVDLTGSDAPLTENGVRPKVKKMKQLSLFEVKTPPSRTSSAGIKSPFTSPSRSMPPLAQKLMKLMKESPNDNATKQYIFRCAVVMGDVQINRLPELIRTPIKLRKEKLDEKKKIDSMKPEEREAYLNEKRNQMRRELRERKREETAKLEDDEMMHEKPLAESGSIMLPDGVSVSEWVRAVSVCEFVRCYKKLLNPAMVSDSAGGATAGTASDCDDLSTLYDELLVDELCQALLGQTDHDRYIYASTVCMLLKPILQDQKVQELKELGLGLCELPVTACTAAEILRLVLPMTSSLTSSRPMECDEAGDDGESVDNNDHNNNEVNEVIKKNIDSICDKLGTNQNIELHNLTLTDKIQILELLKDRILELEVMTNFMDEHQRELCEAYKRRNADSKEITDKLKDVKSQKSELWTKLDASYQIISTAAGVTAASTSSDNNGAVGGEQNNCGNGNEQEEYSSLSARRRQSLEMRSKELAEKEKQQEMERELQRLEKEESNLKKAQENSQKKYLRVCDEAKQLMRVRPVGSDRFNRRYWNFPTVGGGAGVFVEDENNEIWGWYRTVAELECLRESLSERGIRESLLKSELDGIINGMKDDNNGRNGEDNIKKIGFFQRQEMLEGNEDDDEEAAESDSFLVRGFKRELRETETNIRQGSLGGVEDFKAWQDKLRNVIELDDMKECLIAVFLGVNERFLGHSLKTSIGRTEFLNQVANSQTQTRLNLLQSYLDACVMWGKAACDEKCRICRKAHSENRMLLCDGCNQAYHMFCLRPPLSRVPEGEWLCQRCAPSNVAVPTVAVGVTTRSITPPASAMNGHSNQSSTTSCCVCNDSNGEMAECSTCSQHYHASCHEPLLRSVRRNTNNWQCSQCRNNKANSVTPVHSRRKSPAPSSNSIGSSIEVKPKSKKTTSSKRKMTIEAESDQDQSNESDREPEKVNISRTRSSKRPASSMTSTGNNKRSRHSAPSTESSDDIISTILRKLYSHRSSGPFIDAVDKEIVPDYYEIIQTPMCLSDIFNNHKKGIYQRQIGRSTKRSSKNSSVLGGVQLFLQHISLIFTNAEIYNQSDSDIARRSAQLEQYFINIYSKYNLPELYVREPVEEDNDSGDVEMNGH